MFCAVQFTFRLLFLGKNEGVIQRNGRRQIKKNNKQNFAIVVQAEYAENAREILGSAALASSIFECSARRLHFSLRFTDGAESAG